MASSSAVKLPDLRASHPATALLAVLATHNADRFKGSEFDPFSQFKLPLEIALKELNSEESLDEIQYRRSDVLRWAEQGLVGIDEKENLTFLQAAMYERMRARSGSLSFLEIAAVHFPESRTLAERFEVFHAEYLCQDPSELKVGPPCSVCLRARSFRFWLELSRVVSRCIRRSTRRRCGRRSGSANRAIACASCCLTVTATVSGLAG